MSKQKVKCDEDQEQDGMAMAMQMLMGGNSNKIFIFSPLTDEAMGDSIRFLLDLEKQEDVENIFIYINSPGGSITAAHALIDIMRSCKKPINTIGLGMVGSAAVPILANGTKGKRIMGPHAMVMLHQPSYEYTGNSRINITDSEVVQKSLAQVARFYVDLTVKHCNKRQRTRIEQLVMGDREVYLSAEESQQLGLIDKIMEAV